MLRSAPLAVLLLVVSGIEVFADQSFTVTSKQKFPISPLLHSIFFETEINYGSEGGLYAEQIFNRDLESLGRGRMPPAAGSTTDESKAADPELQVEGLDPGEPRAAHDSFAPWSVTGSAIASTDNTTQPFKSNPTTLKFVSKVAGDSLRNPGYWGINCPSGSNFTISFYAMAQGIKSLTAQLVNSKGVVLGKADLAVPLDISGSTGGWKKLTANIQITATEPTPKAIFELVAGGAGTVNLDSVSLIPGNAVAGLFRHDIFDMISGLKPGFIRMPGGNYLEGTGPRTRWDWKNTIGPREARAGHYNTAWGYWVTDAMGLYELLMLCELVHTAPQLSVYTGYSMGATYIPLNQSQQFAQDALDLVEYITADASTPYGAIRAKAGHPSPFSTTTQLRLEVGNEEARMAAEDYPAHYQLITSALWGKHPEITVIASGRWGPRVIGSPCLTGQRCDAWDDHYYRTPDVMAGMGHQYDDYNRSWPDVFVGEFAANIGGEMTLKAAVAEAVFVLGFERNGDKVKSASFAPMLNNVHGTQWGYDLINFDTSRLYALPSYYMQVMFREAAGDFALESTLTVAPTTPPTPAPPTPPPTPAPPTPAPAPTPRPAPPPPGTSCACLSASAPCPQDWACGPCTECTCSDPSCKPWANHTCYWHPAWNTAGVSNGPTHLADAGDVIQGDGIQDTGTGGVTMAEASKQGNDLIIKLACYSTTATALDINLDNSLVPQGATGVLQMLTSSAGANASNTLTNPTFVAPVTSKININATFTMELPAWSIAVLRIPLHTK
jgi:alpha-N-arabinofuranosidase